MILEAARKYNIDLSNSFVIGDSESDITAGENAGCKVFRCNEKGFFAEEVLSIN